MTLGTGLKSVTGDPQKIRPRNFAEKSIRKLLGVTKYVRGLANSRTLVRKTVWLKN